MTRLLFIALTLVGCSAAEPISEADEGRADAGADIAAPQIRFEMGPRETVPFRAWDDGEPVTVVFGPQGGYHTEHSTLVGVDSASEVHLALIWAEVWQDKRIAARSGWEFFGEQWQAEADGQIVELPALIFDDFPVAGPAELRGRLELTDGRVSEYTQSISLDLP